MRRRRPGRRGSSSSNPRNPRRVSIRGRPVRLRGEGQARWALPRDLCRGRPMTYQKIKTCLWFDGNAEEAAEFYVSVFKDSSITSITPARPARCSSSRSGWRGRVPRPERGAARSSSTRRCRCRWTAGRRRSWTSCGRSCRRAARGGSAGGSRTATACRGRSSPPSCRSSSRARTAAGRGASMDALMGMTKLDIRALEAAADAA